MRHWVQGQGKDLPTQAKSLTSEPLPALECTCLAHVTPAICMAMGVSYHSALLNIKSL